MDLRFTLIMMTYEVPILFLIFNRPETTRQVFEKIRNIRPATLFIAADGPRDHIPDESAKCNETRKIIQEIDWECNLHTLFRERNLGCGRAVSEAISWFFSDVSEGIILEDDCLPDHTFFHFCEQLLTKYKNIDQVSLIGGSNFQNGMKYGQGSYYFSHYPHIWGWATWKRVWDKYDFFMSDLDDLIRNDSLNYVFQTKGERRYWLKKFRATKKGAIDTWDYQLTYTIWKSNGIVVTPNVNLVKNIGILNNSTHQPLKNPLISGSRLTPMSFPLIHPEMKIERYADAFTYINLFSYSIRRILKLIFENRSMVFSYLFAKIGS
jgi:hypothetical protein